MEHWTQLTIETEASPDERALLDVASLIDTLRDSLTTWHFFWEPDLWVRLRWRSAEARDAGRRALEAHLEGRVGRLEDYAWETDAQMMGAELWDECQRDWMNGAELSVAHLRARQSGRATKPAAFHWARHVHLFSNQLAGTWAEEARLCLEQARYRVWLLSRMPGGERAALETMVASLDAMLEDADRLAACEQRFVQSWRDDGRPPIVERLDLPDDFAERRAEDGVVRDDPEAT